MSKPIRYCLLSFPHVREIRLPMTSVRLHRLLVAFLLIPSIEFVAAAYWNRGEVLRESDDTIARTASILHEHARNVFDTVNLATGRVDDRIGSTSYDAIAAPEHPPAMRFISRLPA